MRSLTELRVCVRVCVFPFLAQIFLQLVLLSSFDLTCARVLYFGPFSSAVPPGGGGGVSDFAPRVASRPSPAPGPTCASRFECLGVRLCVSRGRTRSPHWRTKDGVEVATTLSGRFTSDVCEEEKRDVLDHVRDRDVKLCAFFHLHRILMFGTDERPSSGAPEHSEVSLMPIQTQETVAVAISPEASTGLSMAPFFDLKF